MSNRVEDPTSLFRQFLNTLSRIPSTTSQDQLDKLTKMQKVLAKEDNLISDQDLAKRERLVKEYEDELRKSSKQSQLLGQACAELQHLIDVASNKRPLEASSSSDHPAKHRKQRLGLGSESRASPAISNRSLSPHLALSATASSVSQRDRDRDHKDKERSKHKRSNADGKDPRDFLYSRQLPLQPGRRIAFKAPGHENGGAESGWILATVKGMTNGDKTKYEVEDSDADMPGGVPVTFLTTIKSIVPLPDPNAPRDSPSHPNAYDERPVGSKVAAIYPDTSSFYWATVLRYIEKPGTKGTYVLMFEDDENHERKVEFNFVIDAAALGERIKGK